MPTVPTQYFPLGYYLLLLLKIYLFVLEGEREGCWGQREREMLKQTLLRAWGRRQGLDPTTLRL